MLSLIFALAVALTRREWQSRQSALVFVAEGTNAKRGDMTATEKFAPFVFLAEDSPDDSFFFERALAKAKVNCSLLRAENGKVAIEMLGRERASSGVWPTLIFLDLKMPVMSGFEVLEWLRLSEVEPFPTVIVLSGSNDHDDIERALTLGAADYLVKPITAEVLRERISRQIELQRKRLTESEVETRAVV